jgi:hypothetical protein
MINQWMEWGTLFLDKPIIMLFGIIIRIEECWPQIWCSLVGLPFQQHTTSLRHGESIYSAYSTKAKLINSWLTSPEQIHQKVQTHSLKSWRYHGYDIVFLWFRQCFTRVVAMGISSPGRHLRWARLGSQADAGPTPNDHVAHLFMAVFGGAARRKETASRPSLKNMKVSWDYYSQYIYIIYNII